ncbi:MAG TPA: isoprenylcysteine carboxylmethyltransferase family protein [Candidatus Eisenbacteria bacterium]|nr:isoprenylcysteine carboxylmethyltransferase family protein [Candidatus Eisenbacteria bacterium]
MTAPTHDLTLITFYAYLAAFFLVERFLTRSTFGSTTRGDRDPLTPLFFVVPAIGIFTWMFLQHGPLPPHPSWWSYGAGLLIGISGMAVRILGKRTLGRMFTVRVQIQEDHKIVDTGMYARVRHPLYAGFILEWMAPPLILGSPIGFLLLTLPLAIVVLLRIPREEALLIETFGDRYRAYMARTKRLIPGIW